jgi:hypothetical protein
MDVEGKGTEMDKTNTLLMGAVATGKTWITRTLLAEYPDAAGKVQRGAGLNVLTVSLEPGWPDTMADCTCEMGMHYHYIAPLDADWDAIEDLANRVNQASDVTKVVDVNKRKYRQMFETYDTMGNFVCDRCCRSFGPVSGLDANHAVVLDGLTGLSRNAMTLTVGLKPYKTWPEFDAAGQQVENFLRKCVSINASFVLIAHLDRETDNVAQTTKLTMHTIGNKLAPRLTKDLFSEIILTRRDDRGRFWWSTNEANMDLKARRLSFSDTITPGFQQLFAGK